MKFVPEKCEQFNLNDGEKFNKRRKISEKIFVKDCDIQQARTRNSGKENQAVISRYNKSSDIFNSSVYEDASMSVGSQKFPEQKSTDSICNRDVIAVSTPLKAKNVSANKTDNTFFKAMSLLRKGCDELELSPKDSTNDINYDKAMVNCTFSITDDESNSREASINTGVKQVEGLKKNKKQEKRQVFKFREEANDKVMEHTVEVCRCNLFELRPSRFEMYVF